MLSRWNLRFLIYIALTAFMTGCALHSAQNNSDIVFGQVDGDFRFYLVGSYGQENDPGLIFEGASEIPIEVLGKIPIDAALRSQGVGRAVSMYVDRVSGTVEVKVIGSGIQNGKSYEVKTEHEHIVVGDLESQLNGKGGD